ncbi:hypothetical protein GCWU000325_01064 [Alloprevotella tannerae ATCC 51259]|uniref:Uncharacterized protein n=1 Tax=Alloprevotella tannerae ATCC 51259 TaxID=626522 RepID=C9LFS6_9BACT|nr:hypothetical protein GCWU000325_01064 [Alloprevotella tannerae ATCC 51259]
MLLACLQCSFLQWFGRPSCFRFLFSHNLFSDLDKSRLRDNKLHDNRCYAAVLSLSYYCLLPPNDGLTPPNDSLLPPNNGLLPPNENESSRTHTEMRAQWLSLRAACGLINRRAAKNGDKNKGRKSPYGTLPTCVVRMLAAEALLQPSA